MIDGEWTSVMINIRNDFYFVLNIIFLVDAGKMPKLNETLSFLERRSTEYFEKRW